MIRPFAVDWGTFIDQEPGEGQVQAAFPASRSDPIGERVQAALLGVRPTGVPIERRRAPRHLFPYPLGLTPLTVRGRLLRDESFFVVGKHLSAGGVNFYHNAPVAHRRVIATIPCGQNPPVALLVDLSWCRFGAHRWYENGGKFVQALRDPADHPDAEYISELSLL